MTRKSSERELRRVVKRILPLVPTDHPVSKAEFEAIHAEILRSVQQKTNATTEQLSQVKAKVLDDLPKEYGRLNEQERSWPVLITYLYSKYLHELCAVE